MGFIPYDYKNGHPDPWVYMETSAIGAIHVGTALVLSSGKLAKCTGTSQPDYISMYDGTVASGDIIPVIKVTENTRFLTTFAAAATSIKVGDRVTIHTDGEQVTATTTSGVAEVSEMRGTASGSEVIVFFPAAAALNQNQRKEKMNYAWYSYFHFEQTERYHFR